ncbi:MAG: AlpA family phage regulatory protein [Proteobacteria bacterium]|nr:AlpA family phage regulatory protein [Pseudomonadota bacterium]
MQQTESNFQNHSNTPERLILLDEVESITDFKSSYIYSKIQKGEFPQPVKIGTVSRWKFSEVQNWVHTKIKGDASGKHAEVRA